jgi:DMSO/TMAO reductase YedYZ molybdopterin-dependent catalytic subunit
MIQQPITRRNLLKGGGGVVAGWSVLQVSGPAAALGSPGSGDHVAWLSHGTTLEETYPGRPGDVVIEWLDQPAEVPPPAQSVVGNLLDWESLRTRLTPADDFFTVKHYDLPVIDPTTWQVEITSLVARPVTLSLADLIARPRREVEFTLECSDNTGCRSSSAGSATPSGAARSCPPCYVGRARSTRPARSCSGAPMREP